MPKGRIVRSNGNIRNILRKHAGIDLSDMLLQMAVDVGNYSNLTEFNETDIGFRFLPKYWGKGIATEVSLEILKYGFEILRLENINNCLSSVTGAKKDSCSGDIYKK